MQTLSRLKCAYPGKDTTYELDFVNDPAEVLEAFKAYYATAELSATTDPNLVYDLRAKLDTAGHYDDYEVERVVRVELNPKLGNVTEWTSEEDHEGQLRRGGPFVDPAASSAARSIGPRVTVG